MDIASESEVDMQKAIKPKEKDWIDEIPLELADYVKLHEGVMDIRELEGYIPTRVYNSLLHNGLMSFWIIVSRIVDALLYLQFLLLYDIFKIKRVIH